MKVSSIFAYFVALVIAIDGQSLYHSLVPNAPQMSSPQGAPPTNNLFRDMAISMANQVPGSSINTVSGSAPPGTMSPPPNFSNPTPSTDPALSQTTSNYVYNPSNNHISNNHISTPNSYFNSPNGSPITSGFQPPMSAMQPPMAAIQPPMEAMAAMQPPAAAMDFPMDQPMAAPMFLPPQMKMMVNKVANSLGHKAYYQAHGCVDPTTSLMGKPAKMAQMAMMMGCSSPLAQHTCQMTQVSTASPKEGKMLMMMQMMMPGQYGGLKAMMEKCLTPTSMMSGINTMLGGEQPTNNKRKQFRRQGPVFRPPPGAAQAGPMQQPIDCQGVSSMLMMSGGGFSEGIMGQESMEKIGTLRRKYLPMQCQENVLMNALPYRLCCPGYVRPPTMQEAMMMKAQKGF